MLDVFNYTETDHSLPEADEVLLIAAAKIGDEDATLRLMEAYGPAIRKAVAIATKTSRGANYGHGGQTDAASAEDLQGEALVAFLQAIRDHDPEAHPRLAGYLPVLLRRALTDYTATLTAFQVPDRTLTRFYGILRHFDGDADAALAECEGFGMRKETFAQVLLAVRTGSLDERLDDRTAEVPTAAPVFAEGPVVDVEDRILVEVAFRAVEDDEARICELAYGFRGTEDYAAGEPVPDEAIAAVVGASRPTVQRRRVKALGKMRKALGVTE